MVTVTTASSWVSLWLWKKAQMHGEMLNCKCLFLGMSLFHHVFFFFFSLSDLILGFCFTLITRFLSVNNRVSERSGKFVTYIVFSVDEEIRDHMLSKVQGFHIVRFLKLHLFGISRNMSTGLFLSFLSSKKWSRY